MPKKRIIIIGAGLCGLSAAWHLRRKGFETLVFEKESEVGGLCRSKQINGFIFDYCGHLLHFRNPRVFKLIKNLLGKNLSEHRRQAAVYCFKRFIRYPFQANLYGLPDSVIRECILGLMHARSQPGPAKNKVLSFQDWLGRTFGEGIARHFMTPYNSKFWTVPLKQITTAWVDGFIPQPRLSEILQGARGRNMREYGYNSRFWYPKRGGIKNLPLSFAEDLDNIYTHSEVKQIDPDKQELRLASGRREKYDYLVSTIPLPEIPGMVKDLPEKVALCFAQLRWNSIFNLNLGIDRAGLSDNHWIYFPGKETSFFRTGFFHNFSPRLAPGNSGSLYAEVAYSPKSRLDKGNIAAEIKEGLEKSGIVLPKDKILAQDINDIKYAYPVYDFNYNSAVPAILSFLKNNKIFSIGRYGAWKYISMEGSILEGRNLAVRFYG